MKDNGMEPEDLTFSPENLAKLIDLAEARGTINSSVAKDVFKQIFHEDMDPGEICRRTRA